MEIDRTIEIGEAPVLRRLLGLIMSSPSTDSWPTLFPPREAETVRATYVVLHRSAELDVEDFLSWNLPRLLLGLTCQTEREIRDFRGRVQGKIDWLQTIKARYEAEPDPTRYVCRPVRRQFDTLENQLLKALLEIVAECLRRVPEVIRAGGSYYSDQEDYDSSGTLARVTRMETALGHARRNQYLAKVRTPSSISEEHLRVSETSKAEDYGVAAKLYKNLRRVLTGDPEKVVATLAHGGLLLPGRTTVPGEAWIQLAAMMLLEQGGGT